MNYQTIKEYIIANGKELIIGIAILVALYGVFGTKASVPVYTQSPIQIIATPQLPEYVGLPVKKAIMCSTSNLIQTEKDGIFTDRYESTIITNNTICGYEDSIEYVRVK